MKNHRLLAAGAIAVALLIGCSSPATTDTTLPGAEPAVVLSPEETTEQAAPEEQTPPADTTPAQTSIDRAALDKAMKTALARVDGKVIRLEVEDNYFEVEIFTGNRIREIKIDLAGERVLKEEDETDREDMARAKQVKVEIHQALDVAFDMGLGTFEEIELGTHRGVVVWEVEFRDNNGMKSEINIDAMTGRIIR